MPLNFRWDEAIATCGTDHELDICVREEDCSIVGGSCLAAVCPDAATQYVRCGMSWEDTDATCGFTGTIDSDCDRAASESCWGNVNIPQGCTARFMVMGLFLMIAYDMVPIFFALLDAPVTAELRGVTLMLITAPAYIWFMPTFDAFFSAYSLNRLADVSWGTKEVVDTRTPAEIEEQVRHGKSMKSMKRWANCVAIIVPLLNLAFAVTMSACGWFAQTSCKRWPGLSWAPPVTLSSSFSSRHRRG